MNLDFLVPIATYPDPTPEDGLTRALDLAASITGTISVVVQEVDIPPLDNLLAEALIGVSALAAKVEEESRERGKHLGEAVRRIAHRLMLPTSLETLRCRPDLLAHQMVALSRRHDASLLVIDPSCPAHTALAEAILFGSGGPVLVCPPRESPGHLRSIAIAWDGSRAAARALRDALPLLRLADSAILLTATEDKAIDAAGVAGAQALLEYHAIKVSHADVPCVGWPIGDVLQQSAQERGAGLLVMGAYGRGRFSELVLGGATRSALQHPALPIFMSH